MSTTEYKTYPGRFYVLVVIALLAMHQTIAWLTFGPIPEQAKREYGLTDVELTLLQGITECLCPLVVFYGLSLASKPRLWWLARVLLLQMCFLHSREDFS